MINNNKKYIKETSSYGVILMKETSWVRNLRQPSMPSLIFAMSAHRKNR